MTVLTAAGFPPLRRRRIRRRAGLPRSGRIFGIGLSRTATSSLTRALDLLGFWSLHYPEDERTQEEILAFLATGGDRLELSILRRVDALTDTPVCATFEALDAAYPGSRFILTTRERGEWLDSCRRFWRTWIEPYERTAPESVGVAYISAVHERLYGRASFDPDDFLRAYDAYHDRVRRHFRDRPGDLITLDICGGEGWGELCEFLRLPEPEVDFPRLNALPPESA
jgi:hypothetical protein